MIRFSQELSEGEKNATRNRKGKVLKCLQDLGISCDEAHTPNITVLGSGGGLRAMIALLGTLVEMQKQGLLDAVMYLCGVSGSTWCMSALYKDQNWTKNVEKLEENLCDSLYSDAWRRQEAYSLVNQAADDEHFSLTDIWASFVVYKTLQQKDQTKLSEHKESSTSGTNPYPIYAAVEANLHKSREHGLETWFEFTPHESGFPGLGAFVSTKYLGSKFEDGNLQKEVEEKNICYLQGLWGSALGSREENRKFVSELVRDKFVGGWKKEMQSATYEPGTPETRSYDESVSDRSYDEVPNLREGSSICTCHRCLALLDLLERQAQASTEEESEEVLRQMMEIMKDENMEEPFQHCLESRESWDENTLEENMEDWPQMENRSFTLPKFVSHPCKLIWKIGRCISSWTWGKTNNFLYNCRDAIAQTTDLVKEKVLNLIDAGLAINSAYPLVLRPARGVKLILSFDFSAGDPFETLKKTAKYCETNQIPFPKINPEEIKSQNNPSDCYIFKGKDVPTVMHFPLFNNKNCSGEIHDFRTRFSTFTLSYGKEDVKELLTRAKMNVTNNKGRILEEIRQLTSSSSKAF
nr:cytosolic phospholipase A2 gamma-like [Pelodiscus sinensis]|eukprot:XP_025045223.1 cytosolic phospholipase A2 gamma-like [Pelodiscus sinensis]